MNKNSAVPAPSKEEVQTLHDRLKPVQEARGCHFNNDDTLTLPLLEQLLVTRKRYGYMACPCRIANGKYELDKDIICPCVYREPDLKEFGACYCGLYVTEDWNKGVIPHGYVPERRPPDKIVL